MSVRIIQERFDSYNCKSTLEEEQALRELTQEIILAGLGRTDFFSQVGFHGGTCLRIFHSLNRFSEDLDFALHKPDAHFSFTPYLHKVQNELVAYGYNLEISDRNRKDSTVRQAFLKDDSIGKLLALQYRPRNGPMRKIRIKLEVDTNPPAGATFEMPILDYPFPAAICIFDLPSLFAGKIHALLCRSYIKGRDWYDFIWYTARKTPINHELLSAAIKQQGPWKNQSIKTDDEWCVDKIAAVIERLNWIQVRQDVQRFVKQHELTSLELWNREFFLQQCNKLLI